MVESMPLLLLHTRLDITSQIKWFNYTSFSSLIVCSCKFVIIKLLFCLFTVNVCTTQHLVKNYFTASLKLILSEIFFIIIIIIVFVRIIYIYCDDILKS